MVPLCTSLRHPFKFYTAGFAEHVCGRSLRSSAAFDVMEPNCGIWVEADCERVPAAASLNPTLDPLLQCCGKSCETCPQPV
jgi:hypothetical protein